MTDKEFYAVFKEVEKRVKQWPKWQKELLSVPKKEEGQIMKKDTQSRR